MRPSPLLSASRKNDAVISVVQNNQTKAVLIQNANPAAEKLVGYSKKELVGKSLLEILPPSICESIESYLEFEDGGNDLATVLNRTRKFQILTKEGGTTPTNLKVFYVVADSKNPCFEMLLRDITLFEKLEMLREQLKTGRSSEQIIDDLTGLPDRESLFKCLELVVSFVQRHGIDASLVLLEVDKFDSMLAHYGADSLNSIIRELGKRYASNIRTEDTIGYLGKGQLGLILFDCTADNARNVMQRIRKKMGPAALPVPGDEDIAVTCSIGYSAIRQEESAQTLLERCRRAAELSSSEGGNRMYEAK